MSPYTTPDAPLYITDRRRATPQTSDHEHRVDTVEQGVDTVEQGVDTVEQGVDTVEQAVDTVEQGVDTAEQRAASTLDRYTLDQYCA